MMTGVGGGLLRDVMANMTPMIFCKRIYAIAALAGSLIYVVTIQIVPELIAVIIGDRNRVYHPDSGECQKMGSSGIRVRTENKIKVQIRT